MPLVSPAGMPHLLHVDILPQTAAGFRALKSGEESLRRTTGLSLAAGVAAYAEHLTEPYLATLTGRDLWSTGYFIVDAAELKVVGLSGYKGPPNTAGQVEIAYCVAQECQGRGYATAAAEKLVALAWTRPEVAVVLAHTLPTESASTRVLMKCGFDRVGEVLDPDDGPVWQWKQNRPGGNGPPGREDP